MVRKDEEGDGTLRLHGDRSRWGTDTRIIHEERLAVRLTGWKYERR